MIKVAEVWATLESAIVNYTGLSPATFFTFMAVAVTFYYAISSYFEPAPAPRKREVEAEPVEPLPPPVQLGEVTAEELIAYDGSDPKKPLLMAIKGQIYDVSQSRMFYGPGGPYALFAGKDASRALAKMSFEQNDLTGDISGLGPFELEALQDWEYKFMSKYVKVGTIKKAVPADAGADISTSPDADVSASADASEITDVLDRTFETPGEVSQTVESSDDPIPAKHGAEIVDRNAGAEKTEASKVGGGGEKEGGEAVEAEEKKEN